MNHERRSQPQVTLEDLLRLKRAERPPVEFWNQFDRDMRVKQLAAIVEPRPWWAPLIRISARISLYQLPVGATAILALTLVTVREYRLPESAVTYVPASSEITLDAMPGPAVPAPVIAMATTSGQSESVVNNSQAALSVTGGSTVAVVEPTGATDVRQLSPAAQATPTSYGSSRSTLLTSETSPSMRSIEANLAAVKANEPELAKLIDSLAGLETRSVTATRAPAVDPMALMQSPSDSRRARLLATALPVSTYSNDRLAATRVDRDLTDGRLYETISRFGVEGSKLAIKF